MTDSDKHCSLLQCRTNYDLKKLCSTASPVLPCQHDKLHFAIDYFSNQNEMRKKRKGLREKVRGERRRGRERKEEKVKQSEKYRRKYKEIKIERGKP